MLTELGYDGKTLQKLRTSIENQKPGKPKDPADKAAAALRKAVLPLIAELPKLPIQQRQKWRPRSCGLTANAKRRTPRFCNSVKVQSGSTLKQRSAQPGFP